MSMINKYKLDTLLHWKRGFIVDQQFAKGALELSAKRRVICFFQNLQLTIIFHLLYKRTQSCLRDEDGGRERKVWETLKPKQQI